MLKSIRHRTSPDSFVTRYKSNSKKQKVPRGKFTKLYGNPYQGDRVKSVHNKNVLG